MSKRIVFTFDDRSYQSLICMQAIGGYPSTAKAVRDSLQVTRTLQSQDEQGFTEVVVRNPRTGDERTLVLPALLLKD